MRPALISSINSYPNHSVQATGKHDQANATSFMGVSKKRREISALLDELRREDDAREREDPSLAKKQYTETAPPLESCTGAPKGTDDKQRTSMQVKFPEDAKQRSVIDQYVQALLCHGSSYEDHIIATEESNPLYAFVFERNSSEVIYFQWRQASLLRGESFLWWSSIPVDIKNDLCLLPPSLCFFENVDYATAAPSDDSELPLCGLDHINLWKQSDHLNFCAMLQSLTLNRKSIAEAMLFAIDHAQNADIIVELLLQSIAGALNFKMLLSRLYLLSDILHNVTTDVPHAWKYQGLFEARLPFLFKELGQYLGMVKGRLKTEHVKGCILAVIEAWRKATIFPKIYTDTLERAFLDTDKINIISGDNSEKTDGFKERNGDDALLVSASRTEKSEEYDDIDGIPITLSTFPHADDDIDGVPLII